MKRQNTIIAAVVLLGLVVASLGCAVRNTQKLTVASSTTLMAYIVEQVGGDKVDVLNIVQPSLHPGNFDAKPADIQKLANARLFLVHGWPGETFVPGLVAAANNPRLEVVTISVDGNWMTPPVQLAAVDKVAAALSQVDTENSATYQKLAAAYKGRVAAKEAEAKSGLAKLNPSEIKVIVTNWQVPFVKWAGFNVVATYGDPQSLTPKVVKELVDKGKAGKVTLIIDNLQSGPEAGAGLAEELGIRRATLSNFPGGFDNTGTWEKAIDRNVDLILEALKSLSHKLPSASGGAARLY